MFRPKGYLSNELLAIFKKKFPLPKNGGHFDFFEFLTKMEKHKFASISLIVRDRAILLKFSNHRVSNQCAIGSFQKFFLSQKMVPILNFRIFSKNVRDREILSKFSTHRVSKQCTIGNFQIKNFLSPKVVVILNFCKKWKNTNFLLCEIERFRRNFRPTGYLSKLLFAIFKNISSPPKMQSF